MLLLPTAKIKLFRHNVGVELQELQQTLTEENTALAAKAEQHNRQVEQLQSKVAALEEKLLQVRAAKKLVFTYHIPWNWPRGAVVP